MKNILGFINKFHFAIIFFLLEILAITFSVNSHKRRYAIVMNSSNNISSVIYTGSFKFSEYLDLKQQNRKLVKENTFLKNERIDAYKIDTSKYYLMHDTILVQQYSYISGQVIKNSILRKNNFITLNKGSKHGIEQDMAVVSSIGVVGIVTNVSYNYSVALSVLNSKVGISAKINKNDYFGSIVWEGENYREVKLEGIPNHIEITKGDTVVTSGYSAIFPENILIGTITGFEKNNQDNFYTINIELLEDFKTIKNIFFIKNLLRKEQLELQDETMKYIEK